ncbi:MAG: dienelactone hydrolase family protein, partial [Gammaproteobacteria bacterium]|nr:dienelactone hydrolase family protein [Gammaproteobacteria bacterium]
MCDEHTVSDNNDFLRATRSLSRRRFGALSAAVAVAMLLPRVANAQNVSESDVQVTTPDGVADCYFVHPASGRYPGVIVWPDVLGLRAAFRMMGKRLAESGYSVLVVNPYYRSAAAPVVPDGASFSDPATRETVMPLAMSLSAATNITDAKAFVAFLDAQAAVDTTRPIGTTGYCM